MLTVTPEQFRELERDTWSEDRFLREVIALARGLGWLCAHFRPARTAKGGWVTAVQGDGKGFPDIEAIRGKRHVYAELKRNGGKVSPEQQAWLDALRGAGREAYVWKPCDWDSIVKLLTEESIPTPKVTACS